MRLPAAVGEGTLRRRRWCWRTVAAGRGTGRLHSGGTEARVWQGVPLRSPRLLLPERLVRPRAESGWRPRRSVGNRGAECDMGAARRAGRLGCSARPKLARLHTRTGAAAADPAQFAGAPWIRAERGAVQRCGLRPLAASRPHRRCSEAASDGALLAVPQGGNPAAGRARCPVSLSTRKRRSSSARKSVRAPTRFIGPSRGPHLERPSTGASAMRHRVA